MRFLLSNGAPDQERIEPLLPLQRDDRQSSHAHYSRDEVLDISQYRFRLFPADLALTQSETDDFRALCAYSQVMLRPPLQIKSHRKWVGPLIVKAKRLMLPLLNFQLKDTLKGIQEFQSRAVLRLAAELVERKELTKSRS